MKVMLADIETDALAAAVNSLRGSGADVRGTPCDVADPVGVQRAAEASYEAFGNIRGADQRSSESRSDDKIQQSR
jgi:NAD(P)-dependent dehydrogenase (short-subunit alcohol dehydrogenase family)